MEEGSSSSGGGKSSSSSGGRSKTTGLLTSTRLQRNQAEKERRDKLNGFISELATLVPMVSNASKPLDKVSILRLAAAEMRLHFSCLNPKRYKNKPLTLPPAIISSLDLIEKTIGGFIVVTTLAGLIVFCSRSIEDYLGYQNIDVMGNKVVKYIYDADIKYFDSKVNSVINRFKKGKVKSKVIKAHMLQKPLPRSNEGSRPRKMIFKISVHQNDAGENNNSNGTKNPANSSKKTRPPKDFGYSAVVLMFIEPVLMEPEIDITYIDSNQDVYFTRHGLQGEIIYADQRISTITGYMPHDVQGTSAYQYICSSDVPIALFAQKAMFTSNDGKGVIVYRLRIRDMRFIYLQSSGQIAYKESSSEISHFVCFNRLLSEEEGSQELKRFQQRYAPQIMAAKMAQMKQQAKSGDKSPAEDYVLDQAFAFINSSEMPDVSMTPVPPKTPFQSPPVDSAPLQSSFCNKKASSDGLLSPTGSLADQCSVHSSEGHSSVRSPASNGRSSSVGSDYNGIANETFTNSSVVGNSVSFSRDSYHTGEKSANGRLLLQELHESKVNDAPLIIGESHYRTSTLKSASPTVHPSDIKSRLQNRILHSVNAHNSSRCNVGLASSPEQIIHDHPKDLIFDPSVYQKSSSVTFISSPSNSYNVQNNSAISDSNRQNEFQYNRQGSYIGPAKDSYNFYNSQSNVRMPIAGPAVSSALSGQQLNFTREQLSQNGLSLINHLTSFPETCDVSPVSSLTNDRLSLVSDLNGAVDSSPIPSSYQENYCNNSFFPTKIENPVLFKGDVAFNLLGGFNKLESDGNASGTNGVHLNGLSLGIPPNSSSIDTFNAIDPSLEMASVNQASGAILQKQMDIDFGVTDHSKTSSTTYQNGHSDLLSNDLLMDTVDWNDTNIRSDVTENLDLAINKELYQELDLFFHNLPQSHSTEVVSTNAEAPSGFPVVSSCFAQNNISHRAKTNHHQ